MIVHDDLIRIALTDEILAKSAARAAATPVYRGSHRGVIANQVGAIGEIITIQYLKETGVDFFEDFVTSHDLRLHDGKSIEIKTKDRTVVPRPNYDCSIPAYNSDHQSVDYHIFVSLRRDPIVSVERIDRYKEAFIVGVANRQIMAKWGHNIETGETDPSNGTQFWTAVRNIEIRRLKPMEQATTIWKSRSQTN